MVTISCTADGELIALGVQLDQVLRRRDRAQRADQLFLHQLADRVGLHVSAAQRPGGLEDVVARWPAP